MSQSTSETGHSVNISNLKKLIDICTGFGDKYNPSNANLAIANLTEKWTQAQGLDGDLSAAEQGMKEPVNQRELLFDPLRPLVTQVMGAVDSSEANALVKKDARGIADRIRNMGKRKKKPAGDGTTPSAEGVSQSHQSFVQRADGFLDLINLLKTVKEYKPNEAELKVESLLQFYQQMKAANDGIGAILETGDKAKLARNRMLYKPGTGIIDLVKAVKQYVKSVYKAGSAESRKVEAVKFRDLPKKEKEKL